MVMVGFDQTRGYGEVTAWVRTGKMNHGVVMYGRGDLPESCIWQMAMEHGYSVAVYAPRSTERMDDEREWQLWSSARVPTTGTSLKFAGSRGGVDDGVEYARYEPTYDDEFLRICQRCSGAPCPTVVLPGNAKDEHAMRLLHELDSIRDGMWQCLHEEFYVEPRQNLRKPEKIGTKLSTLMMSIHPTDGWVYFLGFFRSCDGLVAFLSEEEADVKRLFEPARAGFCATRKADWLYHYGVVEKW
jgi:hypothetical protein